MPVLNVHVILYGIYHLNRPMYFLCGPIDFNAERKKMAPVFSQAGEQTLFFFIDEVVFLSCVQRDFINHTHI